MPKHKRTPAPRSRRLRLAAATTVAATVTGGLVTLSAGPAGAAGSPSATRPHNADFNGDGYADLAVSAPDATVNGHAQAGQVTVLYGSSAGVSAARRTNITQSSAGVPGTPEEGDRFGYATSPGDFNHDGYTDLAVGAPYEAVNGDIGGGTVAVLWGSAAGLRGGTTIPEPDPTGHDLFGAHLAAGDFDGNGKTDLTTLDSSATVRTYSGITPAGGIGAPTAADVPVRTNHPARPYRLTAGDVDADGKDDLLVSGGNKAEGYLANYYLPGTAAGPGTVAAELPGGTVSDIGDLNGDGYGDVVSGLSYDITNSEEQPGTSLGGNVHITYGTAAGPTGPHQVIDQDTAGVPGTAEGADDFGSEVSVGDVNGDGFADIAVGAPREDGSTRGTGNSGAVTVLYGSAAGTTGAGAQLFTQNTAGVPGTSEYEDFFGEDVLLSDLNDDGRSDLAVGVSGENERNGALTLLKSGGARIGTAGALSVSPTAAGVPTAGEPRFGSVLGG
ncbi:hypothetical protein [Streptomyces boninensis]|uniref:hypothetical protein n=1 Tax=Streptomyces boninensis TaxID=2039455 RepID=UPI003B22558D